MRRIHIETGVVSTEVLSTRKYMVEIKKKPLYTKEEEVAVTNRIIEGDELAIAELVERNLRFAVQVAKKYQGMGVPLEDLISVANIGLYEAAIRFEPSRNNRFITFAIHYVKAAITKELNDNSRVVRVPSHRTKTADYSIQSIHTPVGEDVEGETYADRYLAEEVRASNRDLEDLREMLEVAIARLPIKEATAVKMNYGIGLEYPHCMEDIAAALNLTGERARQLVRSGETKLRNMSGISKLLKYI